MHILSFVLAFGFVFASPGFNATANSKLPGAGAFTYSGSQPAIEATFAHLTLTTRGRQLPPSSQGHARDVASNVAGG